MLWKSAGEVHTHLRRLVVRHWEIWLTRWRSASGCWSNCKRGPAAGARESEKEVGCWAANKDRMRRMDGALEWSRNLGEEQELGMNSKAAMLPIQFNPRHLTCLLSFLFPQFLFTPPPLLPQPSFSYFFCVPYMLAFLLSPRTSQKPQPESSNWAFLCWRIRFVQECGGFKGSKGGGEESATATLESMILG